MNNLNLPQCNLSRDLAILMLLKSHIFVCFSLSVSIFPTAVHGSVLSLVSNASSSYSSVSIPPLFPPEHVSYGARLSRVQLGWNCWLLLLIYWTLTAGTLLEAFSAFLTENGVVT